MRLAFVTSHPIQYQAPLFRALAATPGVTLRVFFGWHGERDAAFASAHGFGRTAAWDVPLLDGYDHAFVPNWAPSPGPHHFFGVVSPGIVGALRAFAPDVAIVHGYGHVFEQLALGACRVLRVPTLVRGESTLLGAPRGVRAALRRARLRAVAATVAGFVAIGSLNRAYYLAQGVAPERIFFAPYAVDNAFFQARAAAAEGEAEAWRAELGIAPDALVIGHAAKLSPAKAALDLVRAFGLAALPRAALVIVGDGGMRGELEAEAARHPGATVRFTGFVNQRRMPAAYALADLFVLPSRFEPWGLAVNEAMNMARPVAVSDQVGCAPDLVAPEHGWVFPAGDVEALASVLTDAAGRGRAGLAAMGARARARIDGWGVPEAGAGIVAAAAAVQRGAP